MASSRRSFPEVHRTARTAVMAASFVAFLAAGPGTPGAVRGDAGPHRFALVAGNDQGGGDTRPLLYAKDDARKVWETLTRLGSVRPEDATLLLDGEAGGFLGALGELERRAQAAAARGERTALIVYYSGHAKDGSLRLGGSHLPLASLKSRLAQAPFDVRIGIFDACQSGALTRTKGARRAPAFEVDSRGGRDARGTVILTSSAADEDSQESDQIGGSYFSHHLTSGLLGGADKSGDGRITLSEAYAYAYDRTVADTADSSAGAQHPTFSYDLAGNGDLVLTDVVSRREGLVLPAAAPAGTYYLVDPKGFIAAEIVKGAVERRVALSPGRYRVKRRLPDRLRVGEVEIPRGQLVALVEPLLRDAPFSDDPVKGKGGARDLDGVAHWRLGVGAGYQNVFASPTADLFPGTGLVNLDVAVRDFLRRDWLWGFDATMGGTRAEVVLPTAVLPYRFSALSLATSVMAEPRAWRLGPVAPFVGARVALLLMTRQFDERALPDQFFATLSPGLVGGLRAPLGDHLAVVARGRLHYLLYNVDQNNRSLGYWEAAAFLQYDFGGSR